MYKIKTEAEQEAEMHATCQKIAEEMRIKEKQESGTLTPMEIKLYFRRIIEAAESVKPYKVVDDG